MVYHTGCLIAGSNFDGFLPATPGNYGENGHLFPGKPRESTICRSFSPRTMLMFSAWGMETSGATNDRQEHKGRRPKTPAGTAAAARAGRTATALRFDRHRGRRRRVPLFESRQEGC